MNLLKREAMSVFRILQKEVFVDAETFTRRIASEIMTAKMRATKVIKTAKTTSTGVQTDLKGLKNNIKMFLRNE
jgi:hypothetical protein